MTHPPNKTPMTIKSEMQDLAESLNIHARESTFDWEGFRTLWMELVWPQYEESPDADCWKGHRDNHER
jgi:hypothetical protein